MNIDFIGDLFSFRVKFNASMLSRSTLTAIKIRGILLTVKPKYFKYITYCLKIIM
jgi:hypothetical protein